MKKLICFSAVFLSIISTFNVFGQVVNEDQNLSLLIEKNEKLLDEFDVSTSSYITHPSVLNYFFANKINSYLTSGSNLSLSKGFAFLDSKDNRLFIGGTITNRKDAKDKLSHIFQAGIKADVKDNFSSLFSSEIQNNIGINLKYTLIGRGTLTNRDDSQTQKIQSFSKIQRRLLNFQRKDELEEYKKMLSSLNLDNDEKNQLFKDFLEKSNKDLGKKYIETEANFLDKKGNFLRARASWISFDFFIPVSKSEYKIAEILTVPSFVDESYFPWDFKILPTTLFSWSNQSKLFMGISGGIFQNNSVLAKQLLEFDFNQYVNQGGTGSQINLAKSDSEKVYSGEFNTFVSNRIGMELAYFFPGKLNWIGVSSSFEFLNGGDDFEVKNWKLGIPVSLKDADGKSKINFELQWREFYKNRSVGLSVGLPFGSIIY